MVLQLLVAASADRVIASSDSGDTVVAGVVVTGIAGGDKVVAGT